MNSNLKILGLVLLASLALGGIAAAAAQAETPIKSEGAGVTTLDITNDQNEHGKLARLSFGNKARFVECTSVKVSGLAFTGSVTTITGTPEFAECFANNQTSSPVEVPPIKCKIKFTVRKASTGDATGEGCTNIEVNVYENAEAQKNKKALCAYHIEMPQTVSGALVKNCDGHYSRTGQKLEARENNQHRRRRPRRLRSRDQRSR